MKLPAFFKKNHTATGAAAGRSRNRSHEKQILHDWVLIVSSFVFLVLVVVVVNGYLLIRINKGNFFAVNPETGVSVETLNRKTLFDVAAFFEMREKEYEAFKAARSAQTASSTQVDPSL